MIFNSIFLLFDKALYEEPISVKKEKRQFLSRFTLTESLTSYSLQISICRLLSVLSFQFAFPGTNQTELLAFIWGNLNSLLD